MDRNPRKPGLGEDAEQPEPPIVASGSGVPGFLRQRRDAILSAWESRVTLEAHEVALTGLALRDHIPVLLDELANWLATDAAPETSLVAAGALAHVMQRLDQGLLLGQVLREYRLLRETILEEVLRAEGTEQKRAGTRGESARVARIEDLARLNAGLDIVLSQSIEQFVEERDRRAAAERAGFARLFQAAPAPILVVRPDTPRFTILEVNDAYLHATMRTRHELVGRGLFEAIPDNPGDATIAGVNTLRASLERVLASREADTLPVLRYDIARPDGTFEERWWSPANSAVLDENGEVEAIIHNVHDVTETRRAQAALRASEERKAFLLQLSDALRTRYGRSPTRRPSKARRPACCASISASAGAGMPRSTKPARWPPSCTTPPAKGCRPWPGATTCPTYRTTSPSFELGRCSTCPTSPSRNCSTRGSWSATPPWACGRC